ncbi:MAG: hydrogenase 3 maturation endopeptidase HyCI [Firmicutes bacterium]|nr:hydrogenase 3 maturation endopeptidase HyCI [Bacillota bacterium]
MNEVARELSRIIKKSSRVAFLGVGSPLRSDDNVGNRIVALLAEKLPSRPGREFRFYQGESAPENFTGAIRDFQPEYLIVFDAAELNKPPGTAELIPPERIDGAGFASHVLPLKIIGAYLQAVTDCRILTVGIQPEDLSFGESLSETVAAAITDLVAELVGDWE